MAKGNRKRPSVRGRHNERWRAIIASNMKRFRMQQGLSVYTAAKKADIPLYFWYRWESGDRKMDADFLPSVANVLGVDIEDLFDEADASARRAA